MMYLSFKYKDTPISKVKDDKIQALKQIPSLSEDGYKEAMQELKTTSQEIMRKHRLA